MSKFNFITYKAINLNCDTVDIPFPLFTEEGGKYLNGEKVTANCVTVNEESNTYELTCMSGKWNRADNSKAQPVDTLYAQQLCNFAHSVHKLFGFQFFFIFTLNKFFILLGQKEFLVMMLLIMPINVLS